MKTLFAALLFLAAVLGLFLLWNQNQLQTQKQTSKLKVVTSFYPLYFFASEITGDNANVINVTPAGSEPHDYEPSPQDIAAIENSDLIILNGGNLETWGEKITKPKARVLVAGQSLAAQTVIEDGKKVIDPHIWLSPLLAKKETQNILAALVAMDPKNQELFERRARILFQKFESLEQKYREGLKTCANRAFVTSHVAFGYLASAYHLKQIAISGVSLDEEPSLKQLVAVANFVRNNNVKYIFFETLASSKLSETIAAETGAKTLVLNPLEGLTEDEVKAQKNYFTIMEENLANLKVALSCQ